MSTLSEVKQLLHLRRLESVEVTIQASSGGSEAQDWARLLTRMYMRWLRRHHYAYDVEELEKTEQGLVRRATLSITAQAAEAYALLGKEEGVHRLTRISPFDSGGRRQTSFATVEVTPVCRQSAFALDMSEVRVDTFRSSGKGGQNVNKRDTAVRATHIPTGITAQRQNRYQHQNRIQALAALAARVEKAQASPQRNARRNEAWGKQIRSYAFVPHAMVKDHRTGYKSANLQGVLDGDLDTLIAGSHSSLAPKE